MICAELRHAAFRFPYHRQKNSD